jgi:hypothetical protein
VVFSIVCVWSKCSQCDYVWRSSVLRTFVDYAIGTAGLRRPTRKLDAYVASSAPPKLPVSDADVEVEVDTWSARPSHVDASQDEQIEELFERIDDQPVQQGRAVPRVHSSWDKSDDATVDAFCESLAPLANSAPQPIRAAGSKRTAAAPAVLSDRVAAAVLEKVDTVSETFERLARRSAGLEDKPRRIAERGPRPICVPSTEDLSLAESAERMVRNVESVCETFERLERQFAGLERSCTEMLA